MKFHTWYLHVALSLTGPCLRAGLVFSCSKGTVDLERPIGILPEGGKLLFPASWTAQQTDLVRQLQPMALAQWWQQNHPNWDLLDWDSEVFKADGQLVPCKLVRAPCSGLCHCCFHTAVRFQLNDGCGHP